MIPDSTLPTLTQTDPSTTKRKKYVDIIEYTKLGMTKVVEKLAKEHLVDVNEQDDNGNYAVLRAAERNDMATLKVLVAAGAKLDVRGDFGDTPLGYAQHNKAEPMIRFIKERMKESAP